MSRTEDISPGWLTAVLAKNGITAEVESIGVVLTKQLPYSTVHRLAIRYERDPDDAPRSLFLKLGDQADIGKTEVEFYRVVARRMTAPPLIKCYDAAYSHRTGRSHLLMDDLMATHSQPDDDTAPTEEMSRLAVEALARVHAAWWDSPELGHDVGQVFTANWLDRFVRELHADAGEFLDIVGDEITTKERDAYRLMVEAAPIIWGRLTDPSGLTVTHGDSHWWNFLYPNDVRSHSVHIFDGHTWHIDLGARDLAFLLALGGFAEPRPELEEDLLRAYHEALAIPGYTADMLFDDYRRSAIRNLNVPIIFWKQGKHVSTWRTAMRRALDSFERLRCGEVC